MTSSRIIVSQFCDDIRHEVGNKYSLMGCYGDALLVEKLPVLLPKLCVQIRVITPIDKPFTKLVVRAVLNEDVIAETDALPDEPIKISSVSSDDATRIVLSIMMTFSPLPINEPSRLRIEVEADDQLLPGGGLLFREAVPNNHSS